MQQKLSIVRSQIKNWNSMFFNAAVHDPRQLLEKQHVEKEIQRSRKRVPALEEIKEERKEYAIEEEQRESAFSDTY